MKVLVFYQYSNHNQTIDSLCDELNKHSIETHSLNIVNWRFNNYCDEGIPILFRLLLILGHIPGLRSYFNRWFRDKILFSIAMKYSVIDIHFFSEFYDKVVNKLLERNKKVKIFIWGSDFYRVDSIRREEQRIIYQKVSVIQIETRQIADDFLEIFPECSDKIRLGHYGLYQFNTINNLLAEENVALLYKNRWKIPEDRIVLTCGTNRSDGHRHMLMLDHLEKLRPEIKEKIFLIIPMTYGGSTEYIDTVKEKAQSVDISFKLFPSFVSEKETAALRIISDILITIQITDALSSAIQEYLYSGNILIAGDWLPYRVFDDLKVFYRATSLESFVEILDDTIENIESLKRSTIDNRKRLSGFSSYEAVINEWIKTYNEIRG